MQGRNKEIRRSKKVNVGKKRRMKKEDLLLSFLSFAAITKLTNRIVDSVKNERRRSTARKGMMEVDGKVNRNHCHSRVHTLNDFICDKLRVRARAQP